MAIFNSYVKLPEGNFPSFEMAINLQGGIPILRQTQIPSVLGFYWLHISAAKNLHSSPMLIHVI